MELIDIVPVFNLYEEFWKIYTKSDNQPPQYIADTAQIERCIIGDGSEIYGRVRNCVIGPEVIVEEGAEVYDSILMQGAVIKKGTKIYKSIIAQDAVVGENCTIGVGEYAADTSSREARKNESDWYNFSRWKQQENEGAVI